LSEGGAVLVNPGANVNGEHRNAVDHLAYMSKNLFRFKAWPDSGTVIYLNPIGYDSSEKVPGKFTDDGQPRRILTDNPDEFWSPPRECRGR
jgi:hypothetical protein